MATPSPEVAYPGPQCPFCGVALPEEDIRTGRIECRTCREDFEATAFTPPEKRTRIIEVALSGPQGANACANHARNAAVTSCERCGLFICALCEMNVGEGSFCPSCFERSRTDNPLQGAGRIRDYGSMARLTLVLGLFMVTIFGIPLGALGIYYAGKAIKQRREIGDPVAGMIGAMIFGIVEILASAGFIALMIIGATQ
jgi:hypothetical protein